MACLHPATHATAPSPFLQGGQWGGNLLDNSKALSPGDFNLKLREIEQQYRLGSMEEQMEDLMVVSQKENMAGTGEVKKSQDEGEEVVIWGQVTLTKKNCNLTEADQTVGHGQGLWPTWWSGQRHLLVL